MKSRHSARKQSLAYRLRPILHASIKTRIFVVVSRLSITDVQFRLSVGLLRCHVVLRSIDRFTVHAQFNIGSFDQILKLMKFLRSAGICSCARVGVCPDKS